MSIRDIERKVDHLDLKNAGVKTRKRIRFDRSKLSAKGLATGISIMLIVSFVGFGALLGWFSSTTITADVGDLLLFDGSPGENLETSWNIGTVVGGNIYTESHNVTLSNTRQENYNLSFIVSDNEEDGANIQVLNSCESEITFLELNPGETQQIFYRITFDDYVNMSSFSGSVLIL